MALFNVSVWQRSRFTLQCFIINLVGSLAWLSAVALAQFEWSEAVSGSVSIPDVAFTCIGNLAAFMTAFTRGRLDMENGARDLLATTRGPKINAINGCGLTTRPPNDLRHGVDVVMLSKHNHSYFTQFMQYISHSHKLGSILLQFIPFTAAPVTAEICKCDNMGCQCVVLCATEEIMVMLAHELPGTLKRLSESQCLLPSLFCLKNGCHGCNEALLYVELYWDIEEADCESCEPRLTEGNPRVGSPAAVCEALVDFEIEEESSCICIGNSDRWTKFLIKFLKSKEKEAKGSKAVISDALQTYITHSNQGPTACITHRDKELGFFVRTLTGCIVISERYDSASLILSRVAEVIVNMGLTGWLRVDGFSSSLVARRAIRDHVVDSTGTGFAANAFLTQAVFFGSANWTNACSVLFFRGCILTARRVSYMLGCVNLICSITWSVLIACEGNWAPSTPLSTPRLAVIIGAVGVALGMDCFDFYGAEAWARARARARALARVRAQAWARALARAQAQAVARARAQAQAQVRSLLLLEVRTDLALAQVQTLARARARAQVWWLVAVVILEVGCIVILVMLSMKGGLGRWVHSGMQVLVWVKWGIGSFLLGDNAGENEDENRYVRKGNKGTWVYCSAFLLNAILAGVRRKWVYTI